jgi:hypothetical protein
VWHSISRYAPGPLEVLREPWIQWTVLLPRAIDGPEYAGIRAAGFAALSALGMSTGIAHMEWFRRDGDHVAISEAGARPPGAQFTTLMSYAHDTDMYRAWARLAALDVRRTGPQVCRRVRVREGPGPGPVAHVHGLRRSRANSTPARHAAAEARHPERQLRGDGFIIVRDPDTAVVEDALARIIRLIRVELA